MKTVEKLEKEEEVITKYQFFFEVPLYSAIKLENLETDFNKFFFGDVDGYNLEGRETTFRIKKESLTISIRDGHLRKNHLNEFEDFDAVSLTCLRKGNILNFIVLRSEEGLIKIGQFPSLADLHYLGIGKKYDKILSKQDLHDFKKAIGLSAHGAGAGSLVYLRRIFENIIRETYNDNQEELGIKEKDFEHKRMDEKINTLKVLLPEKLMKMKSAYPVLSKGIHELTEKECLIYFPVLKLSIELILDQKIENEAKKKKDISVEKKLEDIVKKLKN